ncbi:hypothetical protein BD560DRAFT_381544 [Blakeslea trispora]|nr:hypothetical protein BD560DRAFT_381522 [Blakeslea trispora]KAI8389412.1 hypothetical protein BD560DRAFT_381544 [Blakeslea trispora]
MPLLMPLLMPCWVPASVSISVSISASISASNCAYPNVPIQMCLSNCILTVFTASEPPYTFSDCFKKSFLLCLTLFLFT